MTITYYGYFDKDESAGKADSIQNIQKKRDPVQNGVSCSDSQDGYLWLSVPGNFSGKHCVVKRRKYGLHCRKVETRFALSKSGNAVSVYHSVQFDTRFAKRTFQSGSAFVIGKDIGVEDGNNRESGAGLHTGEN